MPVLYNYNATSLDTYPNLNNNKVIITFNFMQKYAGKMMMEMPEKGRRVFVC